MFNLQINWLAPQELEKQDLLEFFISVPSVVYLSQVFDGISDEEDSPRYKLKSIVCFTGTHYYMYVNQGRLWHLHNDDLPVKSKTITDIVEDCLETMVVPALFVYEKMQVKKTSHAN